jgi:hypothetical protein
MEHVPDIDRGFAEMARVTRPGGVVYSQASPLWRSPYGHHKGDLFAGHPWIHLLLDQDEILALCAAEGIGGESDIEHHVNYMLNADYFNMRPAADYVGGLRAPAEDRPDRQHAGVRVAVLAPSSKPGSQHAASRATRPWPSATR